MPDLRPAPLTALSFEEARAELMNRANALRALAGKPDIVDSHGTNPHLIFLEATALYVEVVGKTIDNRSLGALLVTCRNLEDAVLASEGIGYDWRGVSPAVVQVTLNFGPGGWGQDIVLSAGHIFLDSPRYVVLEETTIVAGTELYTLTLHQVTFETLNAVSNGNPAQAISLPNTPCVKGSAAVTVDAAPYAVVDDLFDLQSNEAGVAFRVNYLQVGIITTGTGQNGALIPISGAIVVNYQTSLGSAGRIGAGIILSSFAQILDILAAPVTVTITQPVGSSGGEDIESLESMKFNGPRAGRTLNASINRSDFQTNAEQVAGVLRAMVLTWNEDNSIAPNVTLVLIATADPGTGETTLFADDHADSVILLGDWQTVAGTFIEASGELQGQTNGSILRLVQSPFTLPTSLRVNTYTPVTLQDVFVQEVKSDNPADYLYAAYQSDGGGNTALRLGQVRNGNDTNVTASISLNSNAAFDLELRYTLNEDLELYINGNQELQFTPHRSFRQKLQPQYTGQIRITDTAWVALLDLPIPNAGLIQLVDDYLEETRPTLVTHRVDVGPMAFTPLNLELDLNKLPSFQLSAVRAGIIAALEDFLSVTRQDETGEYTNQPGVTIGLDAIYQAIRSAPGIQRIEITYPADFEITPGRRELLILGEVQWV